MSYSETVHVVAAVVVRDDKFLVCQRPLHKKHGGLWEFPGGKIESGESAEDALRRELREELQVEVRSVGVKLFMHREVDSPFVVAFYETSIRGEPVLHEHMASCWAGLDELSVLPLAPSDRQCVGILVDVHRARKNGFES